MPYTSTLPADNSVIAEGPSEIRENFRALKDDAVVTAANSILLNGSAKGNGANQIPISNGTLCTNLNADKLDGNDATAFAASSHVNSRDGHPLATTTLDGMMSSTDKTKLDNVETGAQANQNAFTTIAVSGQSSIVADGISDTLTIVAGTNMSLTTNASTDTLTINNTYSYTHPTGDGNSHVPSTGTSNNTKVLKAGSTANSAAWGVVNASEVVSTAYGGIASTKVQNALNELDDDKAPKASPTFTGTVTLPSTTSIGTVSNTEIGYLDGVTSAIQTQLNSKAPTASPTFTGTVSGVTATMVGLGNVTNNAQVKKIASSVDNQIMRWNGTTGDLPQGSLATIDDSGSINIPSGQTYKINGVALSASNVGAIPLVTSTDNAIARYNGTTGLVQNSLATVDDNGNINIPSGQSYKINGTSIGSLYNSLLKVTVITDVKASGTDGGTTTSGDWYTRDINTYQINQIGLSAISANRFTLPAGTYSIKASSTMGNRSGIHSQIRLYNVTDASASIIGLSNMNAYTDYSSSVWTTLDGCIEIASSKTFELQYRCSTTSADARALGEACGWGNEIYSIINILKLA